MTADYEAKDVIVAGNRFVGSESPIAWITSRSSHVHHNIFYRPERWVMRILQESEYRRFKPCQAGVFEKNLIVLDDAVKAVINVGVRTDPDSFAFRDNAWFRLNLGGEDVLQGREVNGTRDVDPGLTAPGTAQMAIGSRDPVFGDIGPGAYAPLRLTGEFEDVRLPDIPRVARSPRPVSKKRIALYVLIGVAAAVGGAIKLLRRRRPRESR